MDFSMPIIDGIQATKMIREVEIEDQRRPTILGVTGHVEEKYRLKGLTAGMDSIYSKPLYASVLKNILKDQIYNQ